MWCALLAAAPTFIQPPAPARGSAAFVLPPVPARVAAAPRLSVQVIDLFPDPPSVGGNAVVAPATRFPSLLDAPEAAARATVTPFPSFAEIFLAPLAPLDLVSAGFLGVAMMLGPDFLLAPAGLVSADGIRPGYALQGAVGALLDPDAQWLADRREGLAARAPLAVTAPVVAAFLAAGLPAQRLLLFAIEDPSFCLSVGIISCLGGGLLELIRPPRPTREERDLRAARTAEFLAFSAERLRVGGRCHERDIVAAFRAFYPRYRRPEMSRASDGVSLADGEVAELARAWNVAMGRPAERTPTGFWKGVSVVPLGAEGQ